MMAKVSHGAAAEVSVPSAVDRLSFPGGFLWGAATAAFQIEGATDEDGRGLSIWDTFSHEPGRVLGGDTGDVAADHYHRFAEDVDLMASLGLTSYRFSVSWPRIQSDGTGRANPRGLAFYSRLVDELLGRGITPALTLYHWDLPQALQDRGGWPNRDTAERFADYAVLVGNELGDRVPIWTTLNEPWCSSMLGYAAGVHAPGITDPAQALRAAHHLLVAHGLASRALRGVIAPDAELSIALNFAPVDSASASAEDVDVARRVDGLHNRLFLEPVLRGRYPQDVLADTAAITDWGFVRSGDEQLIAAPIDLLGVNYYATVTVGSAERLAGAAPEGPTPWVGSPDVRFLPPEGELTAMGWQIDPDGLGVLLRSLHAEYPTTPLLVTENGAAFEDRVDADGNVRDPARIQYLDLHLRIAHAAIRDGVDLRGYFVWSLFDNFEWSFGYSKRFGIVYVDFETQQRVLKDSARWYRDVISHDGPPRTTIAEMRRT